MENNSVAGFHVLGTKNKNLKLNTNRMYCWHIPKRLRAIPIELGDIVLVRTRRGVRPVLVMNVFREEDKEKKQKYKSVVELVEKAPDKLSN